MAGWLDLSYKNPYSRRREEYILSVIEEQEVAKVYEHRAGIYAVIGAAVQSKETLKQAYACLESAQALTLPYTVPKAKIKDEPGKEVISKEEIAYWKKILAQKKQPKEPEKT